MTNEIVVNQTNILSEFNQPPVIIETVVSPDTYNKAAGILFISSYPAQQNGVATYSRNLISALNTKFNDSFNISICRIVSDGERHASINSNGIKYILNTDQPQSFTTLSACINDDADISTVIIQHEFECFKKSESDFIQFLNTLVKPLVIVFHTVSSHPDEFLKKQVQHIYEVAESMIVMTNAEMEILINEYEVPRKKIIHIDHYTHFLKPPDKELLKIKYKLSGKKVFATLGSLNWDRSIETTLQALPAIILENPDSMFLIIGKTNPSVMKEEGYKYRNMLDMMVRKLHLQNHVHYINYYLPFSELLEYLQLTDIYLFTSKDTEQAVSGIFYYALGNGCPIVSTPTPFALEVLRNHIGIIIDFNNSKQLEDAVNNLLKEEETALKNHSKKLSKMEPGAFENAAIAYAILFEKIGQDNS